jgi:hypothetical protein
VMPEYSSIYTWHNPPGQPCAICGREATYGLGLKREAQADVEVCVDCVARVMGRAHSSVEPGHAPSMVCPVCGASSTCFNCRDSRRR